MKRKKGKSKAKTKKPAKKKSIKARVKTAKKKKVPRSAARKKSKPRKAAKGGKGQPRPSVIAPKNSVLLGYVEDYFAKIGVIALTLEHKLALGNRLHLLGHTTNFEQTVDSMQIDHQSVTEAGPKDAVGIKVTARVRRGDHVYLIR